MSPRNRIYYGGSRPPVMDWSGKLVRNLLRFHWNVKILQLFLLLSSPVRQVKCQDPGTCRVASLRDSIQFSIFFGNFGLVNYPPFHEVTYFLRGTTFYSDSLVGKSLLVKFSLKTFVLCLLYIRRWSITLAWVYIYIPLLKYAAVCSFAEKQSSTI